MRYAYNILNELYDIAFDIRFIISSQYRTPRRFSLLLSYLRLLCKQPLERFFHFKKEHFLSYTIDVADWASFFVMFREIFIRRAYYFVTNESAPVIIDCGGNIGLSVLFFKYLYPNATITVFEPVPGLVAILGKNITGNNLQEVTVVPAAVGEKSGTTVFFSTAQEKYWLLATTSQAVVASKENELQTWQKSEVSCVTLSSYIKNPVALLKLDIEGGEGAVIRELHNTQKLPLIEECIMEYHYSTKNKANSISELLTLLGEDKFDILIFDPKTNLPLYYPMGEKGLSYHTMLRAQRASSV